MYFTAYEISKVVIEEEEYMTMDSCVDYLDKYHFDHCYEADVDERLTEIDHFPAIFPKGLFTQVGENSFRYNGGFAEWEKSFCSNLKSLAAGLPDEGVSSDRALYRIKHLIENPIGDYMFYFGEPFPWMYRGDRFMASFLANLNVGEVIYIGGVVYFHY